MNHADLVGMLQRLGCLHTQPGHALKEGRASP
jgi:hypothetical protein